MGTVQMKCETNCIMCPGEYIFGHFKIVCKCDCHEIGKHFEVKTFKSYLTNNSEFNKYLHILSKHKHLELRIEDILLTKYKVDHNNKKNLPKIGIQNISLSIVVSIDKAFFENDKLLYYELKEIGKEELSILFKFAFNNVCNNVTIDTVILK
jgi:hypothetical protein